MGRRLAVALTAAFAASCGGGDSSTGKPGTAKPTTAASAPTATPTPTGPTVVPVAVEPRLPSTTLTYEDRKRRFRMTFPADWRLASRRAMAHINDVAGNLTAVATFPIRPRQADACGNAVDEPRVEVGDRDALVMVGHDLHSRADLARKRPRPFRLFEQVFLVGENNPRRQPTIFPWRCRAQAGVSGLWMTFGDSGRVFTVAAIIGKDASVRTQRETLAVLNSMEFWKREHQRESRPPIAYHAHGHSRPRPVSNTS